MLENSSIFEKAKNLDELRLSFTTQAEGLGFSWFAYLGFGLEPIGELIWQSTYPANWTEHYLEQKYQDIDPCVIHGARTVAPLVWGGSEPSSGLRGRSRKMFSEAKECGIEIGVTVPLHIPGRGWGTVTVASRQHDPSFSRAIRENIPGLQFFSLQYHERVVQLRGEASPAATSLYPREIECLKWTAIGKTAWEISELLGISERTVVAHLNNAKQKLGVYSKTHAVVKALAEKIITL